MSGADERGTGGREQRELGHLACSCGAASERDEEASRMARVAVGREEGFGGGGAWMGHDSLVVALRDGFRTLAMDVEVRTEWPSS